MKKLVCISAIAVCAALLCACGKADRSALPDPEELKILEAREIAPLTRDETLRMNNLMCENRALIADDVLYCFDFDDNYNHVLAAYGLTDGALGERWILAESCLPECLTQYGGRLYYINADAGGAIESIGTDGGDRLTLKASACSFLQFYGERMYYCDESGSFCSALPDGGDEQRLIEGACFYPYMLGETVIYQSGDGELLRLRWLEDGTDIELTDHAAYAPVIIGDRLCYTGEDGLYSLGLDGLDGEELKLTQIQGTAEYILKDGGFIARGAADNDGLRQWSAGIDSLQGQAEYAEDRGYRLCAWSGGEYRVDTAYNSDGRIRCFVLTGPEGQETEYIAGRVAG